MLSDPLDRLLGPGVVTVGCDGYFDLDDVALAALRHVARPEPGMRCWCPSCRFGREHDPEPAPVAAGQPWQPRPARNLDVCR